ncbi:hypothetical protein A8D74_03840 [Burkholderia cenocepacia]|nr:hypothetical protein A8D74_03840 [Burkholderia cenocepacia]
MDQAAGTRPKYQPVEVRDLQELDAALAAAREKDTTFDLDRWALRHNLNPATVRRYVRDGALNESARNRLDQAAGTRPKYQPVEVRDLQELDAALAAAREKDTTLDLDRWALGRNLSASTVRHYVRGGALSESARNKLVQAARTRPKYRPVEVRDLQELGAALAAAREKDTTFDLDRWALRRNLSASTVRNYVRDGALNEFAQKRLDQAARTQRSLPGELERDVRAQPVGIEAERGESLNAAREGDIETVAARTESVAVDIESDRIWDTDAADLAPSLITALPLWPQGRALVVHHESPNGTFGVSAIFVGGRQIDQVPAGFTPVSIVLRNQHYDVLRAGQRIVVSGDGNCFYGAVLAALEPAEPREVTQQPDSAARSASIGALRARLAAYVRDNRERVAALMDEMYLAAAPQPERAPMPVGAPPLLEQHAIQRRAAPSASRASPALDETAEGVGTVPRDVAELARGRITEAARRRVWPLSRLVQTLRAIADDPGVESLKRLHTEKKDAWGRFALGGQLLDLASSGPLQALGVELNVVYLRLLRELVDRAKWGTAAHAADLAARLLRSPSHGLFAFSKVPGYYQDVLAWGARHPALFTALGSLLDSVDRQASRGSAPKLTAKVREQLAQAMRSRPVIGAPTQDLAIQAQLDSIEARALAQAVHQVTEASKRQAHAQRQRQYQARLNQVLEQHGLVVPDYMRNSLDGAHVTLCEPVLADFERRRAQLRVDSDRTRARALVSLRAQGEKHRSSIATLEQEVKRLRAQGASSAKRGAKQALKDEQKALESVQRGLARFEWEHEKAGKRAGHELEQRVREQLASQLLAAGVYVENPEEERAALTRCLESEQARRIVSRAVKDARSWTGQVDQSKAIEQATE